MDRLLAATKLKPAELARKLDESEQTMTNWGKRNVSKSGALKAEEVFGISANWILTGSNVAVGTNAITGTSMFSGGGQGSNAIAIGSNLGTRDQSIAVNGTNYLMTPLALWDDETPLDDDEVEIPYFKEVAFAAGDGATHVLEIPGRKIRFSKFTLRGANVDAANAAGAVASGDSMADKIADGAGIGIDKSKTQIKDGKIYAIEHDGMLRVKYLKKLPDGGLRLKSHNKDYEDEDYTQDQVKHSIRVLGWVFWWSTVDRW